MTGTTGTLHEDQFTLIMISLSVLLRMRNVSDKSCRENQNTHFIFNNFFFDYPAVYEIMLTNKQRRAGHRRQYGRGAMTAGDVKLQTHSQNM